MRVRTPIRWVCAVLALGVCAQPSLAALPQQEEQVQAYGASLNDLVESGGLKATGAFPFDYQYLAFYGGSPDLVALWAAASVEAGRIRGVFDGGWRYSLSLGLELFQDDTLVVERTRRTDFVFSRQVADTTRDGFPLQTMVSVPPGDYEYRLVVKDIELAGRPVRQPGARPSDGSRVRGFRPGGQLDRGGGGFKRHLQTGDRC